LVPNICEPSTRNMLHVSFLAPRILRFVIVGGAGNSLDRKYYNWAEERPHSRIAERTTNTTVRFVNILKRHNKPWIKQEKNLHLWLDQALTGRDVSHKDVSDMTSIWKSSVQYMAYD
jgi:hypothetical protein